MVRDLAPFRQLPSHLNYFVNNQNEFLELLSSVSWPCWLREQKLREFNSKDFASDERKIENEIVNYSVSHKKRATICPKNQGKLHHMVVNSRLLARIGDGKKIYLFQMIRKQRLSEIYNKNFLQFSRRFTKSNNLKTDLVHSE